MAAEDAALPVAAKSRVSIYWTEQPVGWYTGAVTSNRRAEDARWETRVLYDADKYVAWHFLDGGEDSVRWRLCDSSDDDD